MEIRLEDTRDTLWLTETPLYRAQLWTRNPSSSPSLREYELSECDAPEAIDWARQHEEPNVTAVVYARIIDRKEEPGLIRLYGIDPTVDR